MPNPYNEWRNHYLGKQYSPGIARALAKQAFDAGYPPPKNRRAPSPPKPEKEEAPIETDPVVLEILEAAGRSGTDDDEEVRLAEIEKKGKEKIARKSILKSTEDPDGLRSSRIDPDGQFRLSSDRAYSIRREDRDKGRTMTGTQIQKHPNLYLRDCYEIGVGEIRRIAIERKSFPPLTIIIRRIN